jgi:predicted SprT family Zn-dependent metalloprotease
MNMSYEEALKDIQESGIDLGGGDYVDFNALVVAVNALEKQIPKNPTRMDCKAYNGYVRYADYYCPVCGKQQKRKFNGKRMNDGWFCERCGQKLIWGNEHD